MRLVQTTLRLSVRFLRPRAGLAWVTPALVVGLVLTLSFVVLSRTERSAEDRREWDFGGGTTAVYLNAALPTTEADFPIGETMAAIDRAAGSPFCARLESLLNAGRNDGSVLGYAEFLPPCGPADFGYQLVDGRWPASAGEVVTGTGTGWAIGERIAGFAPAPLTVVGSVANPNALRGGAVIAAPGTWRSWRWPEAKSAYPNLSATVIATGRTDDLAALERVVAQRAPSAEAAASVVVRQFAEPPTTLLAGRPYLYLWPAMPLALLAVLISVALHSRFVSSRRETLVSVGMSPRAAAVSLRTSELALLLPATIIGAALGWGLGAVADPVVEFVVGYRASAPPIPLDPVIRLIAAVLVVTAGLLVADVASARRRGLRRRREAPTGRIVTVRWIGAVVMLGLSVSAGFGPLDVQFVFASLICAVLAFALITPELVPSIVRRLPARSPGSRLAWRQMAVASGGSPVIAAAAALTVGPVVAMSVLLFSTIARDNEAARLPPRVDQALMYVVPDDPELSTRVQRVVQAVAGTNVVATPVSVPQGPDGAGLVATPEMLGGISLVATPDDLARLTGVPLPAESVRTLNDGGVVWSPGYTGDTVWDSLTGRPITLPDSATDRLEERWARENAGYMLTATAEQLGYTASPALLVFDGVADSVAPTLRAELIRAGLDPALVRTHRSGDAYSVSPFQLGLVGSLGVLGLALLVGASRGSIGTLRRQSADLIAVGVPRGWLARVFLRQAGTAFAIGGFVGIALSAVTGSLPLIANKVSPVIPVLPILGYLGALALILLALTAAGLRRIRS